MFEGKLEMGSKSLTMSNIKSTRAVYNRLLLWILPRVEPLLRYSNLQLKRHIKLENIRLIGVVDQKDICLIVCLMCNI